MIAIFMGASVAMPGISNYFKPKIIGRQAGFRVPDAVRHSSCRSAEPGPYETPAFGTVPALQRTTPLKKRRAALRPGRAAF
jgi:hypothetical protein